MVAKGKFKSYLFRIFAAYIANIYMINTTVSVHTTVYIAISTVVLMYKLFFCANLDSNSFFAMNIILCSSDSHYHRVWRRLKKAAVNVKANTQSTDRKVPLSILSAWRTSHRCPQGKCLQANKCQTCQWSFAPQCQHWAFSINCSSSCCCLGDVIYESGKGTKSSILYHNASGTIKKKLGCFYLYPRHKVVCRIYLVQGYNAWQRPGKFQGWLYRCAEVCHMWLPQRRS